MLGVVMRKAKAKAKAKARARARATATAWLVGVLLSHVSDDEAVANMGHPVVVPGLGNWGLSSAGGVEAVADPGLAEDVAGTFGVLDFFAELGDQYSKVFGLAVAGWAPDGAQQDLVREDAVRGAREDDQEVELLGGEMDGFAADGNGVSVGVDDEIADFKMRLHRL